MLYILFIIRPSPTCYIFLSCGSVEAVLAPDPIERFTITHLLHNPILWLSSSCVSHLHDRKVTITHMMHIPLLWVSSSCVSH